MISNISIVIIFYRNMSNINKLNNFNGGAFMRKLKADEYITNGMFEAVRFGENIIMKNIMTEQQHKRYMNSFKEKYDDIKTEIDKKVALIRDKVVSCNPIQLLSFLSDMGLLKLINISSEFQISGQDIPIARATEYVQSILVSSTNQYVETNEYVDPSGFFSEILKDIEELHQLIQQFYFSWGSKLQDYEPNISSDIIHNVIESQMMYLVRGQRYQVFEVEYYKGLLCEHDMIFKELFNLSSNEIIEGIKKLQYALAQGKVDVINQMHKLLDEFDGIEEDLISQKYQHTAQYFYESLFGTKLRDVIQVTSWPEKFVKELSWDLGEEKSFYNRTEFAGWPIIDLPINKRPFITIKDKYYCFDYYSFVDNFYRALQKMVKRLMPSYVWSDYQQVASENLVENIFEQMLPGCITYTANYYPVNGSIKQAAENDLIVIYDNVIIIVEVKAGSFVFTPPLTDFEAHVKSYKSLIEKADWQCKRTKDYLMSKDYPEIYDELHEIKAKLDMTNISEVFMMSVTIDNINAVAAKAEKMNFLQLKSNAISIGVDDLMVYKEYFNSPLQFLHFLKQRSLATLNDKLALNDELDHLGMYISHNYYTFQTDIISKNTIGNFIGYREELDNYFSKLYNQQSNSKKPLPNIPELFLQILCYLEENEIPNRSSIANYLLNFASDAKEDFCGKIDYVLDRQRQLKHVVPIHAAGTGDSLRYTCFVNQIDIVNKSFEEKRAYTLASLMKNEESERHIIDIYFNVEDKFEKINVKRYTKDDILDDEIEELKELGESIAQKRMSNYKQQNKGKFKIGRNQLCPCGSGKKYKRCCGR